MKQILLRSIYVVVAIPLMYLLAAAVLSRMVRQGEGVDVHYCDVWLVSNGVHVDVVLPTHTDFIDWRAYIAPEHTLRNDPTLPLIAFGWGDQGFYLNTPEWKDLRPGVAFRAAFGLSTSAMHTTYIHRPVPSERAHRFQVSREQYVNVVDYVLSGFAMGADGQPDLIDHSVRYNDRDAFYEGAGRYSMFTTCNSWTNSGLKAAGLPSCVWTPFEGGLMRLGRKHGFSEAP